MSLAVLALFWGLIKSKSASIGTVAALGLVNVPIMFVSYELGVELACNGTGLGEATPVGIINMLANAIGATVILAVTPVLKSETKLDSDITLLVLTSL